MSRDRDVHLLFELGTMRHIDRTWRQFGGLPFANNAEHTFRVAWLAWVIGLAEGADIGRVVTMAMLHDVPETRTGDVNYLTRMYTKRDDQLAISDQFAGTSLEAASSDLWAEYEQRETLESKVVKDADTIDCDLELRELGSHGTLSASLRASRDAAFAKLYTATARDLFTTLYNTDPHEWHTGGRNRTNAGDWKS
jgi:putative hydrolases of HD superfamily